LGLTTLTSSKGDEGMSSHAVYAESSHEASQLILITCDVAEILLSAIVILMMMFYYSLKYGINPLTPELPQHGDPGLNVIFNSFLKSPSRYFGFAGINQRPASRYFGFTGICNSRRSRFFGLTG